MSKNEITAEELEFDIKRLKEHIEKRKANIEIFKKAIAEEEAAIQHEMTIVTTLEADLGGKR